MNEINNEIEYVLFRVIPKKHLYVRQYCCESLVFAESHSVPTFFTERMDVSLNLVVRYTR